MESGYEALFTAAEMRAAEEAYEGFPGTSSALMERAGAAVAREAVRAFPNARRFAVVCGGGSNGGDGRIAARRLREAGLEAVETDAVEGCDVVIDALFGTGFHGAPRPHTTRLIERINACGHPVVAVDLPSGVDASTGEVAGAAVDATLTVTFHASKLGLHVAPGRFYAGEIVTADIGLAPAPAAARRAIAALLRQVPRRAVRDSKFTSGAVLVVGGSAGMTGAPVLTAMAALRADAGYVTLAVPRECLAVVEMLALEPVKRGFDRDDAEETIMAEAERADVVALGPGLGRSPETRSLVARLLDRLEVPVVVDADALFCLRPAERAHPTILTPHTGELARLLERESAWVDAHRLEAARAAAEMYGAVVLLKGADTIVQAPEGGPVICDSGPPSLATAGTGDVLTGVIAAFLAKGLDPVTAAAAAATAHGLAASAVPQQAGLVASDLIAELPSVLG
ncbi:MAG: NAD(P)H-hydrate dehydratase [Thermoleophilia bacterium]|nr:NAD(P)H-hydrate dehydratase [Thermoleophilia bacterium]